MNWLRKGIVGLLSLLLFVVLVGGALSTSGNIAFTHPDRVEAWLSQSHFYDSFITNAIDQAQKSANSSSSRVSLNDPAVKAAAQKAFSPQLLQQDVTTVLNSNYAWLQGKTSTPNFNIDLTGVKQSFADQVGQVVETRLASLPTCTTAQLAQLASSSQNLQNIDPLSIPCRPPGLSPQAEAALVKQDALSNDSFLGSKPTLTANNINPSLTSQSQPYYQKLSAAPKLYRASVALPWVYAIIGLLSLIGIFFIALTKRRGLRRIGIVLLEAGVVLVAIKVLADKALPHLENKIFSNGNVGSFQPSLTDFLHRAETQLTKIDLWFGIAYLVLAVIIFIYLLTTRQHAPQSAGPAPEEPQEEPTPPAPAAPAPRPKPPRLIQ